MPDDAGLDHDAAMIGKEPVAAKREVASPERRVSTPRGAFPSGMKVLNGALGEIRTADIAYSYILSFSLKCPPRDESRGRGGVCSCVNRRNLNRRQTSLPTPIGFPGSTADVAEIAQQVKLVAGDVT